MQYVTNCDNIAANVTENYKRFPTQIYQLAPRECFKGWNFENNSILIVVISFVCDTAG